MLSLNACSRSVLTLASISSIVSSPSISSSTQRQFGKLHCFPASLELRSPFVNGIQPFHGYTRHAVSDKQQGYCAVCASKDGLGALKSKVSPLILKNAKIVAAPPQDNKIKIRVDMDGQESRKAFDTVLKELARHAPPVPGFRKTKGGKSSIVPLNVIYQLLGPKLVRKFIIEEIINAVLQDYAEKEGIKEKCELKTDQSSDELDILFEPGKPFGFDATLDLADNQVDNAEGSGVEGKESVVPEVLEATVRN